VDHIDTTGLLDYAGVFKIGLCSIKIVYINDDSRLFFGRFCLHDRPTRQGQYADTNKKGYSTDFLYHVILPGFH
jgi:hypothetical protein